MSLKIQSNIQDHHDTNKLQGSLKELVPIVIHLSLKTRALSSMFWVLSWFLE